MVLDKKRFCDFHPAHLRSPCRSRSCSLSAWPPRRPRGKRSPVVWGPPQDQVPRGWGPPQDQVPRGRASSTACRRAPSPPSAPRLTLDARVPVLRLLPGLLFFVPTIV